MFDVILQSDGCLFWISSGLAGLAQVEERFPLGWELLMLELASDEGE